jgi:hypothetical protein
MTGVRTVLYYGGVPTELGVQDCIDWDLFLLASLSSFFPS